jgi:hypothetical protein
MTAKWVEKTPDAENWAAGNMASMQVGKSASNAIHLVSPLHMHSVSQK